MNLIFWALLQKKYFHLFHLVVALSINIENQTFSMNIAVSEYKHTKFSKLLRRNEFNRI